MSDRRTILVTGAASGIGAAICRAFASPDTAILIHTRRNQTGADRVAAEVRARGGEAEILLGDLARSNAAAAAVRETVARFGRLDVLVSNAGFADRTPFVDVSDDAMTTSI